jgi:hypothetical protein
MTNLLVCSLWRPDATAVTRRTIEWFNTDTASMPGSCFLRLLPHVDCNSAGYRSTLVIAAPSDSQLPAFSCGTARTRAEC